MSQFSGSLAAGCFCSINDSHRDYFNELSRVFRRICVYLCVSVKQRNRTKPETKNARTALTRHDMAHSRNALKT